MLVLDQESRFKIRSTKRLNSRGIAVIAGVVQSLESVQRYEMEHRPSRGKRTYTYASLIMICMFIEMRHLTYDGDIAQNMLMAMGMPRGDGGYQRPSPARLSDFINNEWPEMEQAFDFSKSDDRRHRTPDKYTMIGRSLIRFVALILRCEPVRR